VLQGQSLLCECDVLTGESFLVTGALGCLGAWTAALLLDEGAAVVAFDLGDDAYRLHEIAPPGALDRVRFVRGDVTDLDGLVRTMKEHGVTHVVHLAALQVPFCKADPPRGARVNVVGTVNVFEAAVSHSLDTTVAYASSAAVYDAHGALRPTTLYGAFKLANEHTARVYAADHGVSSIGLRPFCVYGPGRDQGLTAGPTHAMRAAARGESYRIGFGGRTELHYAPDVARAFILAARTPPDGAAAYDVAGETVSMEDVVAAIEAASPGAEITFDPQPLPFPEKLPGERFDGPVTPLADGVRDTVEHYRAA
jgi:UDP-glucuronate 4-epimerase